MSMTATVMAWNAKYLSDEDRLGLLALAEVSGSDGSGTYVLDFGSGITGFQRLTGWSDEKTAVWIRRAMELPVDSPLGSASGAEFEFEDAINQFAPQS